VGRNLGGFESHLVGQQAKSAQEAKRWTIYVGWKAEAAHFPNTLHRFFNREFGRHLQEPEEFIRAGHSPSIEQDLPPENLRDVLAGRQPLVNNLLPGHRGLHRIEEAQEMNLFSGLDFHARQHGYPVFLAERDQGLGVLAGVVIGDRQQVDP
jgi:hypothetical protein